MITSQASSPIYTALALPLLDMKGVEGREGVVGSGYNYSRMGS